MHFELASASWQLPGLGHVAGKGAGGAFLVKSVIELKDSRWLESIVVISRVQKRIPTPNCVLLLLFLS